MERWKFNASTDGPTVMRWHNRYLSIFGAAVAALAFAAVAIPHATHGDETADSTPGSTLRASSSAASSLPPISGALIRRLRHAGAMVTPVADAQRRPMANGLSRASAAADVARVTTTVGSAVSEATRQFSRLVPGAGPSGATLVQLSTPQLGKETQSDPSRPSHIDPQFQDRLAWAISFPDASIPMMGDLTEPNDGHQAVDNAPLVVFVDAVTGEFLLAESV